MAPNVWPALCLLASRALCFATLEVAADGQPDCDHIWEEIAPLPVALSDVSAGIVGFGTNRQNKQLCVVGENAHGTYCYKPELDRWREVKGRPYRGSHHCSVSYRDSLYLIGGFGSETKFQKFNGTAWEDFPELPAAIGSTACAVYDEEIYYCGGVVGAEGKPNERKTAPFCYRFDLVRDSWNTAGIMSFAVHHAASCVKADSDEMWVLGGRQGSSALAGNPSFQACQIYTLVENEQHLCPELPAPASGMGTCVSWGSDEDGQHVLVVGGELNVQQFTEVHGKAANRGVLPATYALLGGHETWVRLPDLPEAKRGIAPYKFGGYVYVVGGKTALSGQAVASGHRARLGDIVKCVVE